MADFVYVDNSNLYIEGRRASAVAQGLADNIQDAMTNGILDQGYTISFGKLHEFLCGTDNRQIRRAALFGSRPPPNDGIWTYAERAGFELHLEDRNAKEETEFPHPKRGILQPQPCCTSRLNSPSTSRAETAKDRQVYENTSP